MSPISIRPSARWLSVLLLAFVCALAIAGPAVAQPTAGGARKPLLIEGKQTLYQRVLTRPGAAVVAKPGASGGKELSPMTLLFVYGRQQEGSTNWLEVGADSEGKVIGFVPEADTIPWRHSLVLAFTNPANRERVLFYRDRQSLLDMLNSDKLLADAEQIRQQIARNTLPPTSPVVSIEPATFVDMQKQFYLLPILEANTSMLNSGFKVRTVRIASVTKEKGLDTVSQATTQRTNPDMSKYTAGIVFVIDASASMQPYIDLTRAAMTEVYDQMKAANLSERVRFGMVAYRDDPAKVKGIEYLARTFADPNKVATEQQFQEAVKGVRASEVSTRTFAEDGYAGLAEAIQAIDWTGFGGRYLILITDASSREGNSPLSKTDMSTEQIRQLAEEKGMAIYVLYLMTPAGKADHATAKRQYQTLAKFQDLNKPLYFPVEAGDQAKFEEQVKKLAGELVERVRDQKPPTEKPATLGGGDTLAQITEAVDRAMKLAWLGEVQGTKAPRMFEAWASDRDFRNPDTASFSVRVLLTKNQLSDLQATLRKVVEAGEKGQLDPSDFFNQLRSAALAMSRDPNRVGQASARNLEDIGLMGEYLEGLPYQSKIMGLDQDTWARMGVGQQQALIDDVKSKIALYQRFHDDVDRWVQLNPEGAPGDAVYPIPIDTLP